MELYSIAQYGVKLFVTRNRFKLHIGSYKIINFKDIKAL